MGPALSWPLPATGSMVRNHLCCTKLLWLCPGRASCALGESQKSLHYILPDWNLIQRKMQHEESGAEREGALLPTELTDPTALLLGDAWQQGRRDGLAEHMHTPNPMHSFSVISQVLPAALRTLLSRQPMLPVF